MNKTKVLSASGVPVAEDFGESSDGTPIYIDLSTGTAYFLDETGAVTAIGGGGGGGGDMLKSENLSGLTNYTTARSNLGLGSAATASASAFSSSWTEVEIDFGSTPVYDATFTITDAAITSSSVSVALTPCGKAATGRTADDWQWDGGTFAANPGTGSATCYATFHPGPIVGKRMLQYSIG